MKTTQRQPAPGQLWQRVISQVQRTAARDLCRRPFTIDSDVPIVSFTFDDFPRSALYTGGAILKHFGQRGTYYASLGLMGTQAPTGRIFDPADLDLLFADGHELGCHTFDHHHSWNTPTKEYLDSVTRNAEALRNLAPDAAFSTFSYPISPPRPGSKQRVGERFLCCRGGGQTFNTGTTDLNYLSAFFLEKATHAPDTVHALIEENRRVHGWLILATHDVDQRPTPFGCTPAFFETVVRSAITSGARILPVAEAWRALSAAGASRGTLS